MHDQRADRALPRGFLELVGPAAVIGHRPVAELAGGRLALLRVEVGVVDEEHHDLALEVHAFEIVPTPLRRVHAVTDEDHRGARDARGVVGAQGRDIDVLGDRHRHRPLGAREGQRLGCAQLGVQQRHFLHPLAVRSGRLKADILEPRDQIADGAFLTHGARRAPLERVGRERLHIGDHAVGIDGLPGDGGVADRGEQRCDRREEGLFHGPRF